ncbi:MAG: AMP-binding protein, partial [Gammaproteobacteria bacterium]
MGTGEPRTINELFKQAMERRADQVVMRVKRDKTWHDITGRELDARVRRVASALHQFGVRAGDRLALLAESSPEWSIADYAIMANGAVNVPIYPTQTVEQVEFILRNSGSRILFVSTTRQLKRIQSVLDSFKSRERPRVVLFETPKEEMKDDVLVTLTDFEKTGANEKPELFDQLAAQSMADDLATIIYTSGTTGEPKGVMLSHRNLVSNALQTGSIFDLKPGDTALSFLPLSHVFERIVLYIYLSFGVRINFARGVETVAEDIKEVRPSIVTAVPRLF